MQLGLLQMLMPTMSNGVFGTGKAVPAEAGQSAFGQLLALLQNQGGAEGGMEAAEALMAARAMLLEQASALQEGGGEGVQAADDAFSVLEGLSPQAAALLDTLLPAGASLDSMAEAPATQGQLLPGSDGDVPTAAQWLQWLSGQGLNGQGASAQTAAVSGQSTLTSQATPAQGLTVQTTSTGHAEAKGVSQAAAMASSEASVLTPQAATKAQVTGTQSAVMMAGTASAAEAAPAFAMTAVADAESRPTSAASNVLAPVTQPAKEGLNTVQLQVAGKASKPEVVVEEARQSAAKHSAPMTDRLQAVSNVRAAELMQLAAARPLQRQNILTAEAMGGVDQQAAMAVQSSGATLESARQPASVQAPVTTATLPEVEMQAAKVVRMMVQEGEQRMTIRLVPEHLGEVRIEVRRDGDQMSVRLYSANASVRDALETQLHGLRESFTREGLTVQRVEVAPAPPSMQTATGGHQAGRQTPFQPGNGGGHGHQPGPQQSYPQSSENMPRRAVTAHRGALNVFV